MSSVLAGKPRSPSEKRLDAFFKRCVDESLWLDKFRELLKIEMRGSNVEPEDCLECLLRQDKLSFFRPHVISYVETLLTEKYIDIPAILCCTLRLWKQRSHNSKLIKNSIKNQRESWEAKLLELATKQVARSTREDALSILKPLLDWMSFYTSAFSIGQELAGPPEVGPLRDTADAIAVFTITYISYLSAVGILSGAAKAHRNTLAHYLPRFLVALSRFNVELSQNLAILQKQSGIVKNWKPGDHFEDNELSAMTYQEHVADTLHINTRASLFIYLNAMLCGRPLCDDTRLFDYLNIRYNGDPANLVSDLVTASFDALANAINRTESTESINVIRSFLINKIPTVLVSYAPTLFLPLTIESCISQALNRMDPTAYISYTQMLDPLGSAGMLADARSEFLFACALHGLIPEQSIERMLEDTPMQSMSEAGKLEKDKLLVQCVESPARAEELVAELENMEGNASEIVAALIEYINNLCSSKDSMSLKPICNALSCKTQSLDVMMLFIQPSVLVQPLCQLMDEWHEQDNEGEHHPVYDEFSSVFLLILVIQYYFDLEASDLGLFQNSFLLKYLERGRLARDPKRLSDSENKQLNDWIQNLYGSEGISDELMSTCGPKDFHLLVATLFETSLMACSNGRIGLETLKEGFECMYPIWHLLKPILLPSLVTGFTYISNHLSTLALPSRSIDIILPALSFLISPPSISSDSQALHAAILSITATALETSLVHVQKHYSSRPDIDPLLSTLRSHARPQRTWAAASSELDPWCGFPGGGLNAAFKNSVNQLVSWCAATDGMSPIPSYTHRLYLSAWIILGAKTTLELLIDEISRHPFEQLTSSSTQDIALDVAAALIMAPTTADALVTPAGDLTPAQYKHSQRLNLRHILNYMGQDAYKISRKDATRAEVIIRLLRRVQSLSARPSQAGLRQQQRQAQDELVVQATTGDTMMLDLQGESTGIDGMGGAQLDVDIEGAIGEVMEGFMAGDGGLDGEFDLGL